MKNLALTLCSLALLSTSAFAQQQPVSPQEWSAKMEEAIVDNSQFLQFSTDCRYPADVTAGFIRFNNAVKAVSAKAGTPTAAALAAAERRGRDSVSKVSPQVCTLNLDVAREASKKRVVGAKTLEAL